MDPHDSHGPGPLSHDEVFDLLSSARRRFVIHYLVTEEPTVSFTTLARRLAAWENDKPVEEVSDQEQKRVYVSLYQTHLPRLEEAGLVRHDQDDSRVELLENGRELVPYVGTRERTVPWHRYYAALGVFAASLYAAVIADLPVVGAVDESLIVGVVVLTALVTAVVHYAYCRHAGHDLSVDLVRS